MFSSLSLLCITSFPPMVFYVYVIQSLKDGSYYKGFTHDPLLRLKRHNNKESNYTRNKTPWKIVYLEVQESKHQGLLREKSLKKYSHDQLKTVLRSSKNCLSKFLKSGG